MLNEFFDGSIKLNDSFNPDEIVACGAAIQAAILSDNGNKKTEALVIHDTTSMSLGIKLIGDIMSNLIERNTIIPVKKCDTYVSTADNQTVMSIEVYEGEHKDIKDNNLLGHFTLRDIAPAPKGVAKCEVTF